MEKQNREHNNKLRLVIVIIHKISALLLLLTAAASAFYGVVLHSEVYILIGAYISSGSHILEYYFKKDEDLLNDNKDDK